MISSGGLPWEWFCSILGAQSVGIPMEETAKFLRLCPKGVDCVCCVQMELCVGVPGCEIEGKVKEDFVVL